MCRRWFEVSVGHRQDDADDMGTYQVRYSEYYEPYVIMAAVRSFIEIVYMDGNPFIVYVCLCMQARYLPFDERFRGYGMNKCIHLRALAQRGDRFHVIGGHFCLADAHKKSASHRLTYGAGSGYRKHIIAALYRRATEEQHDKVPVLVSLRTAALLGDKKKTKRSQLQLQLHQPRQLLV